MAFEQIAKKTDVLVADLRADGLDRGSAGLEQFLGCRDPQRLNVSARHAARCCLEAADEIARTHSSTLGEMLDRDIAVEMLLQIFFGLADLLVGMRPRKLHHRISRLAAARHA